MPLRKNGLLTLKERRFVQFYIKTGNVSRSALRAGYKHRVSGFENLSKPIIQQTIQDLAHQEGITYEKIASVLNAGLEATKIEKITGQSRPDYNVQLRYVKTCLKIIDPDLFKPTKNTQVPSPVIRIYRPGKDKI